MQRDRLDVNASENDQTAVVSAGLSDVTDVSVTNYFYAQKGSIPSILIIFVRFKIFTSDMSCSLNRDDLGLMVRAGLDGNSGFRAL